MGGWKVKVEMTDVRHVVPWDEEYEHKAISHWFADKHLDQRPECNCRCTPRREFDKEKEVWIFVHSSFDGREGLEWANDILNSPAL